MLSRKERVGYRVRNLNRVGLPRVIFNVSNRGLSCQIVNDSRSLILTSVSSRELEKPGKNIDCSKRLADILSERAKGLGLSKAFVYDRRGRLYHGKVKAFFEQFKMQLGIK